MDELHSGQSPVSPIRHPFFRHALYHCGIRVVHRPHPVRPPLSAGAGTAALHRRASERAPWSHRHSPAGGPGQADAASGKAWAASIGRCAFPHRAAGAPPFRPLYVIAMIYVCAMKKPEEHTLARCMARHEAACLPFAPDCEHPNALPETQRGAREGGSGGYARRTAAGAAL